MSDPLQKPTESESEAATGHLRNYVVLKRRGDKPGATQALDAAIAAAPGSAEVLEHQANNLLERGQTKAAIELLKRGLELYPAHPVLENIYGELVLRSVEVGDLFSLQSDFEVMSRRKISAWFSLFVPGSGQIVSGNFTLGIFFLIVFILSVVCAVSVPNGLNKFGTSSFNGTVLVPIFIGLLTWIASIGEAASASKRITIKSIEHPVPPIDKDYEL